jgi:hypothetical protein
VQNFPLNWAVKQCFKNEIICCQNETVHEVDFNIFLILKAQTISKISGCIVRHIIHNRVQKYEQTTHILCIAGVATDSFA